MVLTPFQCVGLLVAGTSWLSSEIALEIFAANQTLWVGAVFVAYCLMNTFRITTIIGEPSMGHDYFQC
jgi:hypothetical protein